MGTMQVSMRALKSKVVQAHIDEHHQAADQGYVAAEEFLSRLTLAAERMKAPLPQQGSSTRMPSSMRLTIPAIRLAKESGRGTAAVLVGYILLEIVSKGSSRG